MKPVVLFVDDEPNLLAGLKRMTRPFTRDWDIHFAASGPEALEIVDAQPVNTVITDMRMPSMDGAELLERLTQSHPGIFRLALSGESDLNQAMTIVGRSHKFLSKPVEPETLRLAVQQVFDIGGAYLEAVFDHQSSLMDRLKCAPGRLDMLAHATDPDGEDLRMATAAIMSDPSLSVRALQMVNSSYFGSALKTLDIARAVATIGLQRLRKLHDNRQLGPEHSAASATGHDNVLRANAAVRARELSEQSGQPRQTLDLAYATALFSGIGVDAQQTGQQTQLPACIAALLGLPDTLVRRLAALGDTTIPPNDTEALAVAAADLAAQADIEIEKAA